MFFRSQMFSYSLLSLPKRFPRKAAGTLVEPNNKAALPGSILNLDWRILDMNATPMEI